VNWLVKPFSMALLAWLFFRHVFAAWIAPAEADQYIAGTIILAAAPCTAMVFVWSALTRGDPAYTLVQVALNDLLMLVLFVPIVRLLVSGASSLEVPMRVLVTSVVAFLVVPLAAGAALAESARLLRNLSNLPANVCTPRYLAAQARELGRTYRRRLRVRIFDEAGIRRLKMGCFLAVTRGSEEPPRFIVLEYRGARRSHAPLVLVGKGVTFDTGGISLKDPPNMDEMKFDMCGAATVLAAIDYAARSELKINLVGLVPTCENMPDGRAVKPGDIVTSASGQTVEVLNTDAEGRLILCDALNYARRYEPEAVLDFATLTGACIIALGNHFSGVMGNDDALARELVEAGARTDDRAWQLPLTEEYGEQLRSNFADMANVAGREGGAITAAASGPWPIASPTSSPVRLPGSPMMSYQSPPTM